MFKRTDDEMNACGVKAQNIRKIKERVEYIFKTAVDYQIQADISAGRCSSYREQELVWLSAALGNLVDYGIYMSDDRTIWHGIEIDGYRVTGQDYLVSVTYAKLPGERESYFKIYKAETEKLIERLDALSSSYHSTSLGD